MDSSPIIVTPSADPITEGGAETLPEVIQPPSATRVYSRNVLISGLRLFVFACAGVLLPAFLTHRMPVAIYGAWTLTLQIASYIGYLDFGMQVAVAKYVAQYAAAGDAEGCNRYASAGVAVTAVGAAAGIVLSVVLSFFIPNLFPSMPAPVARDVAHGVLLVGTSTAFILASSAFAGIFLGLQQYGMPTFLSISNKLTYAAVLIVAVARHSSLTTMGAAVAVVNIVSAVAQVIVWKLQAGHVRVRPSDVVWPVVREMLEYCGILGIWTAGMLIITGLDTTIVGHVEFAETAFYAIAATPVNFLTMILQAGLNPLMPATSALSVTRTAEQMGRLLVRTTRYGYLILQASGLPLFLFGYFILSHWVGPKYAQHGLVYLRILVLAHIIRNICAPYATMVIATGMQRVATLAGVCEAIVNLATSLILGKIYGAIGVAAGTLIGAVVGVTIHFTVSMRRTQGILAILPSGLLRQGLLRPTTSLLPTLCLLPLFWRPGNLSFVLLYIAGWAVATGLLIWTVDLTQDERLELTPKVRRLLHV